MSDLLKLALLGVASGSLSMTITKAGILTKPHEWLEKKSPFLEELFSCHWCVSHWICLVFTLVYKPLIVVGFLPLDYLVTIMVMVTISLISAWIIHSVLKPVMG